TTPDLTATFNDADAGNTGTITYEVCNVSMAAAQSCAAAGGVVQSSGSSASGIAIGANGTWTSGALVADDAVYYWHARATDSTGLTGSWGASRSFTLQSSVTLNLDQSSINLGAISADTDYFGTVTATVSTNDIDGYTLSVTDEDDAWGADCAC